MDGLGGGQAGSDASMPSAPVFGTLPDPDAVTSPDGTPPDMTKRAPPAISGYEILGELGRGGMGVVYKAREVLLNRPCALKMILAGAHATSEAAARFLTEAEAIARLQHPHIVQIHHIGEADGLPFFELEYVSGGSLDQALDGTPWPPRRAARLTEQLARGITEAHRLGIVHRDLKPGNVLLAADGTPKITDFGLARALGSESGLTGSEAIMGTPSYMAPEQAGGKAREASPAADIYAAGAILYELLTGRPPFRGATVLETLEHVKSTEPVTPSRLVPKLPRDIETICLKCLQKDPARRYESADALAEDLRRFQAGESIVARHVGELERACRWCRRNPAVASLGAGVAALLVVMAVGGTLAAWTFAEKARIESRLRTDADQANRTAVAKAKEARDKADELEGSLYVDRVNRAYREWEASNLGLAEQLLDDCPAARRGWEWHLVKRLCHLEGLTLRGHTAGVQTVAFSPDGSRVASGAGLYVYSGSDDEAELKLWDAATGREVLALPGLKGTVRGLAFSPDGTRLASVNEIAHPKRGGHLTLWEVATGRVVYDRPEAETSPLCVAFSPDGKTLAVGSGGFNDHLTTGHVTLRDAATGDELFHLPGQPGGVRSVAFSPDGKTLAAASAGVIELWDLGSRAKVHDLRAHQSFVYDVAFSPDGRILATGGYDGIIKLWDPKTGEAVMTLYGHTSKVEGLDFSPDGKRLASSSEDMSVRLWDPKSGRELASFRGHTSFANGVAFSPDGRMLASAGQDRTVKLWDVRTSRPVVFREHTAWVQTTSFSPDGKLVASSAEAAEGVDNTVRLWDPTTGDPLRTFPGHVSAFFSPEGRSLFTYTPDDKWHKWDLSDLATPRELKFFPRGFPPPDAGWIGRGISPDGRLIRTVQDDKVTQQIWDVPIGKRVATLRGHRQPVIRSDFGPHPFSPDGRLLASLGAPPDSATGLLKPGHELKLWDVATGREIHTVRDPTWRYREVAFSPDGRLIALFLMSEIGEPETARILDTTTGSEVLRLRGHTSMVCCLAFSPDGKRIATGSGDLTIKLWDASTGQEVLSLRGHTAAVISVAFSPDGHRLVSGSIDWTARVWDATPLPETSP
jgi:WD40 repeat protein/tRNA A-37 threonylcarbamoyl transferase component Bud32